MLKRYLSIMLAGLLVFGANTSFIFAQTKADANVEKVKASVVKRGANEKKKVRVKLLNGTTLKGYISQVGDDSFTLTDSKTKQSTVISYRDASKVKGTGLSKGAKIGIIIGVGVVAAATILFFVVRDSIYDSIP